MSTHNIPVNEAILMRTQNMKKRILTYSKYNNVCSYWNVARVRNSRGKRAISVRATEVLLYSDSMSRASRCAIFYELG